MSKMNVSMHSMASNRSQRSLQESTLCPEHD
jgi:hypothetical protein